MKIEVQKFNLTKDQEKPVTIEWVGEEENIDGTLYPSKENVLKCAHKENKLSRSTDEEGQSEKDMSLEDYLQTEFDYEACNSLTKYLFKNCFNIEVKIL